MILDGGLIDYLCGCLFVKVDEKIYMWMNIFRKYKQEILLYVHIFEFIRIVDI